MSEEYLQVETFAPNPQIRLSLVAAISGLSLRKIVDGAQSIPHLKFLI
jgi:hypothetical protein